MSIRRRIIDYSRGINMDHLWRLYMRQKKAKNKLWRDIVTFRMSRCAFRHGGYIGPDAEIEGMPEFPHGLQGIFISRYARIGKNCWIYQNVTIGEVNKKAPVIGDNCLIGAGAIVLPGITIGKYAVIGAGSIVNRDIPDYTVAAGNPCKPIRRIDQRDKEYYWKDKRFDSQQ